MRKLPRFEKTKRRQRQLMRRAEKEKKRRKRSVYLRYLAQHTKAKK